VTLWRNRALYGMARTESNANDPGRPPFPIPEQQSAACITSVAASLPEPEQDDFRHHCRRAWARLIRKVWSADPLVCPKCSGRLRIISFIENPPSHLPGGIIPDDFHPNRCYSAPTRKKRTINRPISAHFSALSNSDSFAEILSSRFVNRASFRLIPSPGN